MYELDLMINGFVKVKKGNIIIGIFKDKNCVIRFLAKELVYDIKEDIKRSVHSYNTKEMLYCYN